MLLGEVKRGREMLGNISDFEGRSCSGHVGICACGKIADVSRVFRMNIQLYGVFDKLKYQKSDVAIRVLYCSRSWTGILRFEPGIHRYRGVDLGRTGKRP